MLRYISIDRGVLKKMGKDVLLVWLPGLLVEFPQCLPRTYFLYDCYFRRFINNKYIDLYLLRKIESKNRPKLEDEAPLSAKLLSLDPEYSELCSSSRLAESLQMIAREMGNGNYTELYSFVDQILSDVRDVEYVERGLFRLRKYTVTAEEIRERSRRITLKAVINALKILCLDKPGVYGLPTISAIPIYVLFYIDHSSRSAGFIVEKKIMYSYMHTKLVSKYIQV